MLSLWRCDRRHRPQFRDALILNYPVLVPNRPAGVALRLPSPRCRPVLVRVKCARRFLFRQHLWRMQKLRQLGDVHGNAPRPVALGGDTLAAREKRQGQNRLAVILYDHHQSRIILVAALFSQVSDCVLGIRKRCRYIWQIRAITIILDPIPSVYREEILRHRTPLLKALAS